MVSRSPKYSIYKYAKTHLQAIHINFRRDAQADFFQLGNSWEFVKINLTWPKTDVVQVPHFNFGFGCTENDGQKPGSELSSCVKKTQTRANRTQRKNIDTYNVHLLKNKIYNTYTQIQFFHTSCQKCEHMKPILRG